MKTFEELGVSPEIRRAIEEMGYENPMPVQEEVIPYLLGENNDVVALAQTGTRTVQTPVFMNVGTQACHQGRAVARQIWRRSEPRSNCPTPTTCICVRATRWCKKHGRPAQVHDVGWADSDGLRRVSGIFPCGPAEDQGGGRDISPLTSTAIRSSWARRRACVSSRTSALTLPWRSTSAWKTRRRIQYAKASCERTARWLARCKEALAQI